PFSVTVTALDQFGNTVTGYLGTVQFTTTDTGAGVLLPTNYTFTATDAGVHTFTNAVALVSAGSQTLTVADAGNSSITGPRPSLRTRRRISRSVRRPRPWRANRSR